MPPARSAAAVVRQIRLWFVLVWRSLPGTVALHGSFGIHNLLALWALYRRRTLRMPAWEASQLSLGLLELTVRNREAPLAIFVAPSAGRLAERLARVPA